MQLGLLNTLIKTIEVSYGTLNTNHIGTDMKLTYTLVETLLMTSCKSKCE